MIIRAKTVLHHVRFWARAELISGVLTYWANESPANPGHVSEASGQLAHKRGMIVIPLEVFESLLLKRMMRAEKKKGPLNT